MTTLKSTPDVAAARADHGVPRAHGPRRPAHARAAADRRRVRPPLLPRDAAATATTFVLALNSAPFDFDALPFVNVARLLAQVPVPIPAILGHADDLGILARRISATSRCRRTSASAAPGEHTALYRQAIDFIAAIQRRGRELASDRVPPVRHRVRRREAHLGDGLLREALRRGLPRRDDPPTTRGPPSRAEFARHRRGTGRRAARALPPRLPQPQPDAGRTGSCSSSTSRTRAWGPTPTISCRCCATPTWTSASEALEDYLAYFLALDRRAVGRPDAAEFRRRFDLMALQRNLKALGTFGYQTATRRNPVYIQYIPRTLRYARDQPAEVPALRAPARTAGASTSRNCADRG